jgi:hypothetical protein
MSEKRENQYLCASDCFFNLKSLFQLLFCNYFPGHNDQNQERGYIRMNGDKILKFIVFLSSKWETVNPIIKDCIQVLQKHHYFPFVF